MKDFTMEYRHGRLAWLRIDEVKVSPGSLRRITFKDEAAEYHPALSIDLCGSSNNQAFSMKHTAQDVIKTCRDSVPYNRQPMLYGDFPGNSHGDINTPPNDTDTASNKRAGKG